MSLVNSKKSPFSITPTTAARFLPRAARFLLWQAALIGIAFSVSAAQLSVLAGNVSNSATGTGLQGARIEIPALGLTALTDNTGRYVMSNVPTGTHEVTASYIGLETARATVQLEPGQGATKNFDLTDAIYRLGAFKVTGEREGAAAAITAERNALNLKNVVSLDSFVSPNLFASDIVSRFPGVAGQLAGEGTVNGFMIRGTGASLNTTTIDGELATSQNAVGREGNLFAMDPGMFDQVELIKGHTPDKPADSLGGTVNLKTRSPLNMRDKRRFTYSLAGRWAPPFTEQIPLRERHRNHQTIRAGYQEVFSVLGGERNLGIALNLSNSESVFGYHTLRQQYEPTANRPAYVWEYYSADIFHRRDLNTANAKIDFRVSPYTKLSLLVLASDQREKHRRTFSNRLFTAQSVGTAGTTGVLPGYTDYVTRARPVAGSGIDVNMVGPNHFRNYTRRYDLGAEHRYDRLQLDYNLRYARTHTGNGSAVDGGNLTNRITNIGWTLDKSASDVYPLLIQTEGPDLTDPANYRPTANGLMNTYRTDKQNLVSGSASARYDLRTTLPVALKTGLVWREQRIAADVNNRRWNYRGTAALATDPTVLLSQKVKTGLAIPQWDAAAFIRDRQPRDPALWTEDDYYRVQSLYQGEYEISEAIAAGYVMAQGRIGRTGWIAGVRREKTETESTGNVRARVFSSTSERLVDPIGTARRDYGTNRRELQGAYTRSFPSAHLSYDFTQSLRGRVSWSSSYGRPLLSNAIPNETPNESNQTLTFNNASLVPQTAMNWDTTLDYYFEPVGNLSIGWFHKKIRDYIVTGANAGTIGTGSDNGFNGDYAGFTRLTSLNAGTATVQGWEVSYQQQFTFLPGVFKGLGLLANYTLLDTHGDFGGTKTLSSGHVAGFVPRNANLSLTWRYRGFSTRFSANYTSLYLQSYNAANPGLNLWLEPRTVMNVGVSYKLTSALVFSCDVDNLTDEESRVYVAYPERIRNYSRWGTTVTFGISGTF
jgi:TonB-dependent receptor